ncbi:twin-arginine translocation signal domain-containing protein [Vibrio lentus]|nr:twin-arginine translocation signal domain-containing protein [Vibrio lentus]
MTRRAFVKANAAASAAAVAGVSLWQQQPT